MSSKITTELVKELRDKTGISIMQCKKALEEAGGDIEKALILLKKKGAEVAGKKSDRTFASAAVAAYVHGEGTVGAMVELRCETDFVSRNDDFRKLAYDIAMHIAASNPEYRTVADIPEEAKKEAEQAFEKEVAGKPAGMKEKILEGKVTAYFKERVLLEQSFIKNPEQTISQLLETSIHKFGEKIELSRFARFAA